MIQIREHVKLIDRMRVFKDGDSYCIVLNDFQNLQESPAYFIEEWTPRGQVLAARDGLSTQLYALSHGELCHIAEHLLKQAEAT